MVAALFVAMNLPARIYELMPLARVDRRSVCLESLSVSFRVQRHAQRRTGHFAPGAWMLGLGLAIGGATLLFGEYVTPYAERAAQQMKVRATSGIVAQEFPTGLWAKDGAPSSISGNCIPMPVWSMCDCTSLMPNSISS
jgi:lipopolysaccharide export system permease protein